jgi:hypothetical protein
MECNKLNDECPNGKKDSKLCIWSWEYHHVKEGIPDSAFILLKINEFLQHCKNCDNLNNRHYLIKMISKESLSGKKAIYLTLFE